MAMDFNKIFNNIKELGHVKSRREELREYCKLKVDQILKFLPRRILNNDGADLLDCIFNGLPDNHNAKHKQKVIDTVLQTMKSENSSLTHCGDVISRLCLELPRQPVSDLVRWNNGCVQSIVDDSDVNMIWRDVLPECLNALSAHATIKHCGTEMSPVEYKEQCVHTLCQCQWKERQLVQLAAMFKDMQLSRENHKQVVNKLSSYILETPPDTLPPLVHQLLKVCKTYHIEIVLGHLSHYFSVRLYSKLEPPPQDSESTTMDIDDITPHSPAELSRCLSTCIYHITQGAAEPELIRKVIKTWPKTQLLRAPFLLDLALAVSDKGGDFRSVCLDVIRLAIELRVTDEIRAKESAWTRSVLPPDVDVASVLKVLTTESANHRQLTVIGLINLAFALLSVFRTKPTSAACWSYGKLILARLCKAQPETAPHVLAKLADALATCTHPHYSDCLHVLCLLSPVSIERCTQLSSILENCQPTPTDYKTAAAVLNAVHPLINFSTRTRDTLVMVCRKGLYSRDSMHRCLALSGFLSVLKHVKLSRVFSSSQSVCSEQYSAHSYLTQLAVDLHATQQGSQVTSRVRNEAMCMEVISILRRCLVQDAAVKQLLYSKIYECAKEKPALHESILELVYEHLSKYLPDNSQDGPPLLLDKCVQITPTTAVLIEPISRLLYATAQYIQPSEEEDLEDILGSQGGETGSAYLQSKLTSVMQALCAGDYRIDMEEPGLTDLTPESKAKYLKVQQLLQCYEALMAHQLMQWTINSDEAANSVYKLFKAYNQLLESTKAPPKLSKKGSKSTLNDTRDTNKTQKSQKSQKEKGKGPTKVSNLIKDRAGPFKPLPCLWDLNLCLRVLELLYNEKVPWSSIEQSNQLRARRDFHHYVLRSVQTIIAGAEKKAARTVAAIAAVMYKRCICRFREMCEFDDQTAHGCIEVFKECLTFLFSPVHCLKVDSFLPTITGIEDASPSVHIPSILERIYASLQHIEAESGEEEDANIKKFVLTLVSCAAVLLDKPVKPCPETATVITKLEDYIRTSKQECSGLILPLLTASFREQQEAPFLDDLLLKLTAVLGRIDEEDTSAGGEEPTNFPTIDAKTGHSVLSHVCVILNARHKNISHLLCRARDLTAALSTAAHANHRRIDVELKELYKSLVVQLCQLCAWTARVSKLRCSVGGGSDKVLATCVRLYSLLATIAKQLDSDTAKAIRFERLLKLSGKKMSAVTDNLITYLEASSQEQSATKVLRDTKLIPRLVLEVELFTKHVILLQGKELNYQQYLSLGTARDFRIKGPVLQEVLQARDRTRNEEDENNIDDAVTEVLSAASDDEDKETNKRKRRRVS